MKKEKGFYIRLKMTMGDYPKSINIPVDATQAQAQAQAQALEDFQDIQQELGMSNKNETLQRQTCLILEVFKDSCTVTR